MDSVNAINTNSGNPNTQIFNFENGVMLLLLIER